MIHLLGHLPAKYTSIRACHQVASGAGLSRILLFLFPPKTLKQPPIMTPFWLTGRSRIMGPAFRAL